MGVVDFEAKEKEQAAGMAVVGPATALQIDTQEASYAFHQLTLRRTTCFL
jgi:hypothetical protein